MLKIVKFSTPLYHLVHLRQNQSCLSSSVAISALIVTEGRNQNCYQFVYYTKKYHSSYLELCGFS